MFLTIKGVGGDEPGSFLFLSFLFSLSLSLLLANKRAMWCAFCGLSSDMGEGGRDVTPPQEDRVHGSCKIV